MLKLRNVHKSYGAVQAVRGIDLDIDRSEFLTLLGPSGCGKTTLLRCIAGLEKLDQGSVSLHDRVLDEALSHTFVKPEKRNFGMVFQSYALWPHMNVIQNVAYPLIAHNEGRSRAMKRAMEVLALVGLGHLAERPVARLSGGQQQRVALARAVVGRPDVTLFDEPLSNLDATLREALRDYIREAHAAAGGLSIYVTHDQAEALALSDRIAVVFDGQIRQLGIPSEIYTRPTDAKVADFIGFDNRLSARVVDCDGERARLALPDASTELIAAAPVRLERDQQVVVFFRSSHLRIVPAGGESVPNQLEGTVAGIRNLQSMVELDVHLGRTALRVRVLDGPKTKEEVMAGLVRGERIRLAINEDQAVALVDADSAHLPTPNTLETDEEADLLELDAISGHYETN